MKKIVILLTFMFCILLLCSCNPEKNNIETESEEKVPISTSALIAEQNKTQEELDFLDDFTSIISSHSGK